MNNRFASPWRQSAPRLCLLALLLLLLAASSSFGARKERIVDGWRPTGFDVQLTFNDALTEITRARTEISIQVLKESLSTIDLDFGEMPVDAVTIAGHPAPFTRSPGLLTVQLPAAQPKDIRFAIVVEYHGKPKDGLVLGPDKDGKPSATGDNWPNRVHHWIPCLDHPSAKAPIRFTVTAPRRDLVVANGSLNGVRDASPTERTWTYSEVVPIPAYCMVVGVAEYARSEPAQAALTPLWYYVPQSDASFAAQGFGPAGPAIKFYSDTIAPYPYEKLAL